MASSNGKRPLGEDFYTIVRGALAIARAKYGNQLSREIEAVIGYFILQQARAGLTDPYALAETAILLAKENPDILGGMPWN